MSMRRLPAMSRATLTKPGSNGSNANFYLSKEYATPIGNRVLVRVKQKEIKTESGLAVVQTNPVLPIDGTVIAIGDSKKVLCCVGDRVCFDKYAGVEVRLNGEDHIVMYAHEVLGVLE